MEVFALSDCILHSTAQCSPIFIWQKNHLLFKYLHIVLIWQYLYFVT